MLPHTRSRLPDMFPQLVGTSITKAHQLPLYLSACLLTRLFPGNVMTECCMAGVHSGCKAGPELPGAAPRVPRGQCALQWRSSGFVATQ